MIGYPPLLTPDPHDRRRRRHDIPPAVSKLQNSGHLTFDFTGDLSDFSVWDTYRITHLSRLLCSYQTPVDPPCSIASRLMVFMTGNCLVDDSPYPLIHPWFTGPPGSSINFVLLDVTDPARHYLKGLIDRGTKCKRHIPPAIAERRSEIKEKTTGHDA